MIKHESMIWLESFLLEYTQIRLKIAKALPWTGVLFTHLLLSAIRENYEFECWNMAESNRKLEDQDMNFAIILIVLTCRIHFIDF